MAELTRDNYTYAEVKGFLHEADISHRAHIKELIDEIESIGLQLQTFQQRGKTSEYSNILIPIEFWNGFKSRNIPLSP